MAGNVRQPIDIASLERYISANVPEIQIPLDVKQVCVPCTRHGAPISESSKEAYMVC